MSLEIGKALRLLRAELNISQDELAKIARVDKSTISGLESDQREPSWRTLVAICEGVGIGPAALLSMSLRYLDVDHQPLKIKNHE